MFVDIEKFTGWRKKMAKCKRISWEYNHTVHAECDNSFYILRRCNQCKKTQRAIIGPEWEDFKVTDSRVEWKND